jgi:hypothetical protein
VLWPWICVEVLLRAPDSTVKINVWSLRDLRDRFWRLTTVFYPSGAV